MEVTYVGEHDLVLPQRRRGLFPILEIVGVDPHVEEGALRRRGEKLGAAAEVVDLDGEWWLVVLTATAGQAAGGPGPLRSRS